MPRIKEGFPGKKTWDFLLFHNPLGTSGKMSFGLALDDVMPQVLAFMFFTFSAALVGGGLSFT